MKKPAYKNRQVVKFKISISNALIRKKKILLPLASKETNN